MSGLVFLHPWILAGLAALPLLYFLLRVTPPAPRRIVLPSARFLDGLVPDHPFPSRTPWWILLLRMAVLALILTALAGPVLHPADALPGKGTLRLLIDNGWESAQTWSLQMAAAQDLLARAERENRPAILLPTARPSAGTPLDQSPALEAGAARARLSGLRPLPWPSDWAGVERTLQDAPRTTDAIETVFLSAGLGAPRQTDVFARLQTQGSLSVFLPAPESLPVLLAPAPKSASPQSARKGTQDAGPSVRLIAPQDLPSGLSLSVQALDARARVLDHQTIVHQNTDPAPFVSFDVPDSARNAISRFQIAGRSGPGAVLLADERLRRRVVGILTPAEQSDSAPLVGETYYLKRALEPYVALTLGPVETLMKADPSLILVPDMASMPPGGLERLDGWVRAGGTLMRFAGPKMAATNGGFLLPVALRGAGRSLGGRMSWTTPLSLGAFPADSPLADLAIPEDVKVRRQVLSQDSEDPSVEIWMRLSDGTPLLTAQARDRGRVVLLHTTAGPEWSDLALSGLYVDLLRRMASLSAAPAGAPSQDADGARVLQPLEVLDGAGVAVKPGPEVKPIAASAFETIIPAPEHPPGLYGAAGTARALNLGERLKSLPPLEPFAAGVETRPYAAQRRETTLAPLLLAMALGLFLMDWALALALSGALARLSALRDSRRWRQAALLVMTLMAGTLPLPARAQVQTDAPAPVSSQSVRYASALHLAFVRSGDPAVDAVARDGLKALAETLRLRTSVAPADVAAIDPASDDLSFFPLVYWPVAPGAPPLSGAGLEAVQDYLGRGGTILFDTRDQGLAIPGFDTTPNTAALRRMIGLLNVPDLVPVPEGHVIGRSFYLLGTFPGRYEGGTLWVEAQSTSGRDGVSSVLVGANDWAGAWAQQPADPTDRRNEMAMRFGVNLVMYALTGNYKADQVHVPHILERLGRKPP
ncbi:MAG TPA: DUF4159 domain-containing protein [Alphaproteobacteria bacterium]|nr:DUF4159 domain-containing protein [Alphaproteobacteria bacterium]